MAVFGMKNVSIMAWKVYKCVTNYYFSQKGVLIIVFRDPREINGNNFYSGNIVFFMPRLANFKFKRPRPAILVI